MAYVVQVYRVTIFCRATEAWRHGKLVPTVVHKQGKYERCLKDGGRRSYEYEYPIDCTNTNFGKH